MHLLSSNPQVAQLAVGVRGGTQTAGIIIHALRDANAGHATIQLDVKNAFNELDRGAMLRAAKQFGPALYGFAAALYGNGKQDLSCFLVLFQSYYTTLRSVLARMVGIDGSVLARVRSLRPVLG